MSSGSYAVAATPGVMPPGYVGLPGSQHPHYRPPGDAHIAVPAWVLVFGFVVVLISVVIIAAAVVIALTPSPPPPACIAGQPCAPPPPGPPGLVIGKVVASERLGYTVSYAPDWWTEQEAAPEDVRLVIEAADYGSPTLWIHAAPASEKTVAALAEEQLAELGAQVVGLAPDPRPQNLIQGAEIGYTNGTGATWTGSTNSPQGPGRPVVIYVETASNGRVSVSAALVLVGDFTLEYAGDSYHVWFRVLADNVLNSFAWPQS